MRALLRTLTQLSINANPKILQVHNLRPFQRPFSTQNDGGDKDWTTHFGGTGSSANDSLGWDTGHSSWSTGLTKEHFAGEAVGKKVGPGTGQTQPPTGQIQSQGGSGGPRRGRSSDVQWTDQELDLIKKLEAENRQAKRFVDGWDDRMHDTALLMKQVREPGARGSYLKDSEKNEMYKKHKENPEVYTVERLAKEYRIMRQRVHAILWLKEDEEKELKKRGELDDSVELLLDTCPEFFNSHCREFHVASLPYKPDFKVMPEGWDGTTRDPDEVHYEISMKEDEMLYKDFVQRLNFNKLKFENKVKVHKYSRRRPPKGWNFTVEKLGRRGKRGNGGGWKFISEADGSTRPLNDLEKMFVKRETPQRRKRILP